MDGKQATPVTFEGDDSNAKFPLLDIAYKEFSLKGLFDAAGGERTPEFKAVFDGIVQNHVKKYKMAPYYENLCKRFGVTIDYTFLNELVGENDSKIATLKENCEILSTQDSEIDTRDAHMKLANYYCVIGEPLQKCLDALEIPLKNKTCSIIFRYKIYFQMLRLAIFHKNQLKMSALLKRLSTDIDEELADWEARNKLKIYQILHNLWNRDFVSACDKIHKIITTFNSYEVVSFSNLGKYAVIASVICLDRNELKTKAVNGPEIAESNFDDPTFAKLSYNLFHCRYLDFFNSLAHIEKFLKNDFYLSAHASYIVKELKLVAYSQLLRSFKSLKLQFLAETTNQPQSVIDQELSEFIRCNRLCCKIDKLSGEVFTQKANNNDMLFNRYIEQANFLLLRVDQLVNYIN